MQKFLKIILLVFSITLILSGCGEASKNNKRIKIYTTNFPYKSMTEQIGGKYVDVESIYPSGADVHNYEPSQKEMINVAKSDLFIFSSRKLDPVGEKIGNSINDSHKLEAIKKLNKEHISENSHKEEGDSAHEHEQDPHIWLDPVINKEVAKSIKNKLVKIDKAHQKIYESNYKDLIKDIDEIDKEMERITRDTKRDTIYISHDSLGYLAKRYHFKQVAITGMNNEEPSQKELLNIIKNIKNTNSPYILYEQNVSSRITDIIKKDSKSKPLKFHNLEVLTKKEKNEKNISYQTLMKQNIENLDIALNK